MAAVRFAPIYGLLLGTLLSGCGPDTVGAAATSASAAAAAAQEAKQRQAQLEAQIKATQDAEKKRVEGISEQVDGASR
jgi:hypothetical protein